MRSGHFAPVAMLVLLLLAPTAQAADHSEAPGTRADLAADIADLYAWAEGDHVIVVLSYGGLQATTAGQSALYDTDVLYQVHLDRDGDQLADSSIELRYGQDGDGNWGLQVVGLPGADGTLEGAVGTVIGGANGTRAWAGLRDDPFFFDLEGFNATLATGDLSIQSGRDSVAGLNVSAIVLRMDRAAALGAGNAAAIWATTGRI